VLAAQIFWYLLHKTFHWVLLLCSCKLVPFFGSPGTGKTSINTWEMLNIGGKTSTRGQTHWQDPPPKCLIRRSIVSMECLSAQNLLLLATCALCSTQSDSSCEPLGPGSMLLDGNPKGFPHIDQSESCVGSALYRFCRVQLLI